MPAYGYRKGVSDDREPLPVSARTRLPLRLHHVLREDARQRCLTVSRLMRAILEQHYGNRPLPRPRSSAPAYAIARELNRIGVNLNQLTHTAHIARLVPKERMLGVLSQIEAAIERL